MDSNDQDHAHLQSIIDLPTSKRDATRQIEPAQAAMNGHDCFVCGSEFEAGAPCDDGRTDAFFFDLTHLIETPSEDD